MKWRFAGAAVPAIVLALPVLPAAAQDAPARLEAGVLSDYRERGLSWSEGRAAVRLQAEAAIAGPVGIAATAVTARGAARHGGAQGAIAAELYHADAAGPWRWHGAVVAHVFPGGRGAQDYLELDLGAGTMLGPLDLSLLASYVPPQRAVGGSNVHGRARARLALPGTPWTLVSELGWSGGTVDDRERARRLRPGGGYRDWAVGAEYAAGRFAFGLTYSDNDISGTGLRERGAAGEFDAHSGAALVAAAGIIF